VTDSGVVPLPLRDQPARDRIATDLKANLLVEAGAGSGKTTALVGRMVALVSTGTATVEEISAVTFTRKAAAELRERFQMKLEERLLTLRRALAEGGVEALEDPVDDPELVLERLQRALDGIDRAFIGTIHSFCGRLLRERPLDVGLDPAFEELPVEERAALRRGFWDAYLERLARESDPLLEDLSRAGLRPVTLYGLFDTLVENPDVVFPAEDYEPPRMSDVGAIRGELEGLVDRAWELMDEHPPARGWDSLQKKLRGLHFEREITEWQEPTDLFQAVAVLCKTGAPHKTTLNRWRDAEMARSLVADVNAFGLGDTPAQRLVDRWYAHRYALAIRLCRAAASAFAEHRIRAGRLDFQDLLVLAARLLRENPTVRSQLGTRYRRLLVDEFQDTDPLQAEIMLLLSSEPGEPDADSAAGTDDVGRSDAGASDQGADWRVQVPREGALFVVGDPKQSIYRFRRADIQLYGFVRDRFEDFGDVLTLSTNFRSRPPIGDVVNDLFDDEAFFPREATSEQAAFERLDTRPPTSPVPREGVYTYLLAPDRANKEHAAIDDATRLATWIRGRVDQGERRPEDFLILTRLRPQLAKYANALEAFGLPVQVTGAGIGVEDELREVVVLLECMIDPTNPVRVVSALVGLFFGLDYERLVQHRLAGGGFDAMSPRDQGHPDVVGAVRKLHGWWRASNAEPADVFVGRLTSELGVLPLAAAGELGALRAGALLFALDAVRAAALAGDSSLPGALGAIEAALDLREAEAPLEPGRTDAIRLMNLHQAKGLEGTVVVLADPTEYSSRVPDAHMRRSEDGVAEGFLRVSESRGAFRGSQDLARPMGWADHEAAETAFSAAEDVRLLYVAVTRAREELVVARWPEGRGSSAWAPLDPWLDEHAEVLTLERGTPPDADALDPDPGGIRDAVDASRSALARTGRSTYAHATVTSVAKAGEGEAVRVRSGGPGGDDRSSLRGFAWGSAVHGALALAASQPDEEVLRSGCRDLLIEHQRPLDDRGDPVELLELLELVQAVRASDLWARAQSADRRLVEVPFAVTGLEVEAAHDPAEQAPARQESERRQLDLFGGLSDGDSARDENGPRARDPRGEEAIGEESGPRVLEGVLDLAFREKGGWVIADYKTDVGTDADFPRRAEGYRRQVELYARAWSRLTGEKVKERVLFYTAQGRLDSW
jgi:ATP-dependent helicase/nuclease subunit A